MFLKILLVLLALGLGLLILRAALGKSKGDQNPPSTEAEPPKDERPSRLYACSRCGAMTPKDDVVWRDGEPYCCRPHADL